MSKYRLLTIGASMLAIALLGTVFAYGALFLEIPVPASQTAPVRFEILAGSSLSQVAEELAEAGYLKSPSLFKLWARFQGLENNIQTGEYELHDGITPAGLLGKIATGQSVQYRITFIEGWTFQQALDALLRAENISHSLAGLSLAEVALRMGLQEEHPEGLIYPDTYFYTKGTTDIDLLTRANQRLESILSDAWQTRLGALPYDSPYEALTMASIIEKESASNSERGLIAGVFVARLGNGMRLQSDPTTIYGMGERYRGNITRADLSEETPYNTYRIDGLPPTPIALSGSASIHAALNPSATDFLYFVSRGDGSHHFSRTLEEHNAAVREFQLSPDN